MKFLKVLTCCGLIACAAVITGCATSANHQAMTVMPSPGIQQNTKLRGVVAVRNVGGGKETNPLWTSQVDNQGFKKALENSLAAFGYLAVNPDKATHIVDADLNALSQPFAGLDMNVSSTVTYKVTSPGVAKQYPISVSAVATFSDAALGYERLRIANERSINENIKQFLKELSSF
jgi:hypothetical protein